MRVLCQATKTASWRCGVGLAACAMPLREARAAGGRRQQLGVGAQPHCFGTPGRCRCERENGVVPRLTVSGSQCACTTTTTSAFRRSGTDAAEAAAERNCATRAVLGTRASAGGRPWQEGEAGVRRVMAKAYAARARLWVGAMAPGAWHPRPSHRGYVDLVIGFRQPALRRQALPVFQG